MAALDGSTAPDVGGFSVGQKPFERAGPGLRDSEANALIEAFCRASLSLNKAGREHSRATAADQESAQTELDTRRAAYDDARQDLYDALTGVTPERFSQHARDIGPPAVDPAEVLA